MKTIIYKIPVLRCTLLVYTESQWCCFTKITEFKMLHNFSPPPATAHQCFCSSIPAFAIQNQLNELLVLIHGLKNLVWLTLVQTEYPVQKNHQPALRIIVCITPDVQQTFAPIQFQRESSSTGTQEQSVSPMASLP